MLNNEPGYEVVEKYLPNSIMSAVNLSEVVSVLASVEIGVLHEEAENLTTAIVREIISFDQSQGLLAALWVIGLV